MVPNQDGPAGYEVFEILVREHADMLCAFLRSLVRRSEVVDDLFQETMLVAWRRIDDFDREREFGPWLRGIAAKLVLAHRRKSASDFLRCDPEVLEGIERRLCALESRRADSFRHRIQRLRFRVDRLPEHLRETVTLAYARGLLLKQVAEAVESSEEAVKKRVQHARRLLTECLTSTEVADEPAGAQA